MSKTRFYWIETKEGVEDCIMYWYSNFMGTDNFSTDFEDATLFMSESAAWAIIDTFDLREDCKVGSYEVP